MSATAATPFPQDQLVIKELSYDDPVVRALEAELQQEYVDRYGGVDQTPVQPAQFGPPDGMFLVAFVGTEPIASGGLRRHDSETAEIKRMYVVADRRGAGYARRMLHKLESGAVRLGYRQVVLETGLRQPEAIRLYESSGYSPIPAFGIHACSEFSRCYAKDLLRAS